MTDTCIEIEEEIEVEVALPKKYKVVLHNDNITTVEFVVHILVAIFHKEPEEALAVTLQIHFEGMGLAGIYTHEIAEQKREETIAFARANNFPLTASLEEAE